MSEDVEEQDEKLNQDVAEDVKEGSEDENNTTEEMNNEVEAKNFSVGDLTKGTVTKIEDKHALVDVGFKVDGIVPISELSSLHIDKVSDILSEGDELELKVTKVSEDEL